MISIEHVRNVWHRAATFPSNKEGVYPDHAKVQEFDLHRGAMVLEYGCGGGSDAMSYLRRNCTVWYVDVVPTNVQAAQRRIEQAGLQAKAYGLVLDESAKIPLPGQQFDVINAHGVLHHIEEPEPVVAELARLLKPGGLAYVMLYTEALWKRHLPEIRDLIAGKRVLTEAEAFGWCTDGIGVPYARYYTEAEGADLLERHGLQVLTQPREYANGDFRTFKGKRA